MAQIGNKQNSFINGEWAKHVRRSGKKITAHLRRQLLKRDTQKQIKNNYEN